MPNNLPTPTLKALPTPTRAFYFTQITVKPSAAKMAVRLVGQKPQSEESEESEESPLLKLPAEILQTIASRLPTDLDMLNLALSCRYLHQMVLDPRSTTWRSIFKRKYNLPHGRRSRELMAEYQTRAIVLHQTINFKEESPQQQLWLQVIFTLLSELLTLPLGPGNPSKTLKTIQEAVTIANFFGHSRTEQSSDLFCAIQLCLTALSLDKVFSECYLRTGYDIAAVYSYDSDINGPFIDHDTLDFSALLHMRQFWQRHLLNSHEGTFHKSFAQLAAILKPKMRRPSRAGRSTGLSTSWMGYYSCIHPLPDSIEQLETRQTCADLDSHWDQVETMSLEIEVQKASTFWPQACNNIIPRCEKPGVERFYFDGLQKIHGDSDAEPGTGNPLFGFIEPIASPYGGIPGWVRICFAICEQTYETEEEAWSAGSSCWVHGYEAVIVPGGGLMIGRWVDLKEPSGRGPFIFWDV